MKKSKENKRCKTSRGITLVPLLVTVVLMLIIVGVVVGNGLQSADNVQLQSFFKELQIIQKRVDVISEEAKMGNNSSITYNSTTQIYTDTIGESIQNITDETKVQEIENLKDNKQIYQYTIEDYVQSGKIFHLDGYQNLKSGADKTTTKWEDLSSNNYEVTVYNAGWNGNGSGMFFSGYKQYVQIANPIKDCNTFTIEILVQPEENSSGQNNWKDLLTFDTQNKETAPRLEATNQTGQYKWYKGGIFTDGDVSGKTVATMTSQTTHLISIVVDENTARLYNNGILEYEEKSLTDDTVERIKTDYINICNRTSASTGYFRANIYAIRMYDHALTQSQVGKNYLVDTIRFPEQNLVINQEKTTIVNDYYYYTPNQLEKIGIEGISQDVLINWETRDVVSVEGFTSKNETYYRDSTTFQPEYQEEQKQNILFSEEDNIVQSGEAIKQIEVAKLKTVDGQDVDDFEVKYREYTEQEENSWILAKNHSFQTAIPGTYEIQVSGNKIETKTIQITLDPEFSVEVEQVSDKWRYTIHQIFGEYKYKKVAYQYRLIGTTEWLDVLQDTFETTEQGNYEIQAIDDSSLLEKTVIGNIISRMNE